MEIIYAVTSFIGKIWKPIIEICLFWYGYYVLLKFLRSTGALQVLRGLFIVFVAFMLVQVLGLDTIARLMKEIIPISVIAFVVVFQNELRRGLTRIGSNPIFKMFLKEEKIVDEIVKAVSAFSTKRIGGLIAVEREISLKQWVETGIHVDGVVSFELLSTIFIPTTPLHDGGVILRGSRIESAACLFPLSQSQRISKTLGTRHRAALGLTEETDAVVIVVSEETGLISVASGGEFRRDVDVDTLRRRLMKLYKPTKTHERPWKWRGLFLGEGKS